MPSVKKATPVALHQFSDNTSILVLSVVLEEAREEEMLLAIRTQVDGVKITVSWLMVGAHLQNDPCELSKLIQAHGAPAEEMDFIEALNRQCVRDMAVGYKENSSWLEYELIPWLGLYVLTPEAQTIADEINRQRENDEQESECEDAPESAPENATAENSTFALDLLYTLGILGGAGLCIAGIMAPSLALTITGGIIAAASGIGLAYTHGFFDGGSTSGAADDRTSYTPQYT